MLNIFPFSFYKLNQKDFSEKLLNWHRSNARSHPWKDTSDPYKIWISEIILQQTRVETGTAYYLKFIKKFPSVSDLSRASLKEVLATWQGLGYYSRARNLHASAQFIHNQLNGIFPQTYKDILKLKGVGPYTAAAIASFAFLLPYAVLDGNVKRVLARYHGYKENILTSKAYKQLENILSHCFDRDNPAKFNQAIMDFGATICKPKQAICDRCPLSGECFAFQNGVVESLPIRQKLAPRRDRYFHFFVIRGEDKILMEERISKDIWQNLYQFPLHESQFNRKLNKKELDLFLSKELGLDMSHTISLSKGPKAQLLTHQRIISRFYELQLENGISLQRGFWFRKDELDHMAFPKIIDWYLKDNSILLNF